MMACKAAVKAGAPLSETEMRGLLSSAETVDKASACPHGRPTTLRLTLKDLEKQFHRG
jgi:DNA mismatch repair protein MutL